MQTHPIVAGDASVKLVDVPSRKSHAGLAVRTGRLSIERAISLRFGGCYRFRLASTTSPCAACAHGLVVRTHL